MGSVRVAYMLECRVKQMAAHRWGVSPGGYGAHPLKDDEPVIVVTVLYFAGCPNWQKTFARVLLAADQVGAHVSVTLRAVETDEEAERVGFTGSPTVLLNGVDPFAQAGAVPAFACRVYATPDGLAGAPTVEQFVDAMKPLTA